MGLSNHHLHFSFNPYGGLLWTMRVEIIILSAEHLMIESKPPVKELNEER